MFILAAGAVNSADIRAGWTASVSGLAGVAGGVSAVSTVAVEAHGSVSASLTSDSGYVTVWTSGDVTGTVVAGLDAIVNARGSVTGSVSAGGEDVWGTASVSAGGSVTGSVTGTWVAIEVTYDMYMFITTALGARTQQDIDKAGDRFAKGVGTLTVEGGTAAATLGAGALLGAVGPVAKAGKKPVKNRADGKVEVDIEVEVRGRMAEPPPARDGRKGVPAPDPSELAAALLTLRTKLKDVVGTKVLQHVADKLKADPAKELETLKALETMARKIKEYKGGTKPARWVDTDEKVRALLTAVLVENKQLANLPVDELVRDLKDVSHLPSFVPALKQLVRDDPQLKGNLAEIVETAKDLRATPPKVVEDIAQRIEVKYRDPEDGRRVKTGHSDIDIISDGTLWQLKIGPTSLLTGPKFKLWLVKAIAAAKATGKTKIGFRFDPDAMNAYNKTDVYKDILKDLRKKNPDVEILDPVPIPNPIPNP